MKAIFGGAIKKPLMTKVSMRHLNEIVRERNQYSRDAVEAWQDFINLKGRMDTELVKVTKRNNFLVEELESWKQQVIGLQSQLNRFTMANPRYSSSNFKHLQSNLPRKRKSLRLKLNLISVRIVALRSSLINNATMLLASRLVCLVRRSNGMMHSKHWSCSKR